MQEDKDNFCNAVRNEVKATGMLDTQENCWDFFISKVSYVLEQEAKDGFEVAMPVMQLSKAARTSYLWMTDFVCCLQVRKYLHVVLCFSPVGDKFRVRARQFPALVNCTQFDWFHGWPSDALISVAKRFLSDVPAIDDDTRQNISLHMAYAHQVSEIPEAWSVNAPEWQICYMETFKEGGACEPHPDQFNEYSNWGISAYQ